VKGSENIDLYRLKENSHELKLVSIKLSHGLQNQKNQIRFRKSTKILCGPFEVTHCIESLFKQNWTVLRFKNFNHRAP